LTKRGTCGPDNQHLGMGRWVAQLSRPISGLCDNPRWAHDYRTNGNFTAIGGQSCLFQRDMHMRVEFHEILVSLIIRVLQVQDGPSRDISSQRKQGALLKRGAMRKAASMSDDIPKGDRIAKVLSRAGIASRREAERMIAEGRVTVNGKVIDSPALNIIGGARITVDGKDVGEPDPPRIWLYHKPAGLVTTERDEKDRATVFASLPEEMPRVMSVGRLDINSEGLLILTNDGELKRKLELPSTGWLRRYRVRIKGSASEASLDKLRAGITVESINYQPMTVTFDRQQGANAWLTISIREGKNREIRRAMEYIGATVNRLIRVSYGPFQLGSLPQGEVEELKQRVVRDQLGLSTKPQPTRARKPVNRPVKGRPTGKNPRR
jgi:23S rRNA pseudouridine2605 synthase